MKTDHDIGFQAASSINCSGCRDTSSFLLLVDISWQSKFNFKDQFTTPSFANADGWL
jgi:hypothetical protein